MEAATSKEASAPKPAEATAVEPKKSGGGDCSTGMAEKGNTPLAAPAVCESTETCDTAGVALIPVVVPERRESSSPRTNGSSRPRNMGGKKASAVEMKGETPSTGVTNGTAEAGSAKSAASKAGAGSASQGEASVSGKEVDGVSTSVKGGKGEEPPKATTATAASSTAVKETEVQPVIIDLVEGVAPLVEKEAAAGSPRPLKEASTSKVSGGTRRRIAKKSPRVASRIAKTGASSTSAKPVSTRAAKRPRKVRSRARLRRFVQELDEVSDDPDVVSPEKST